MSNSIGDLKRVKILVCGVLPPPRFGHSVMYEMLMASAFPKTFNMRFLSMHFWSYKSNKRVTFTKIAKMIKYLICYSYYLIFFRPKYVLYNISFYPMPFMKDFLFCAVGILFGVKVVLHDHGQYVDELYRSLSSGKKKMLRWMLRRVAGSVLMGERTKPVYGQLIDQDKLYIGEGGIQDLAGEDVVVQSDSSDAINILYFSHVSYDKGADIGFSMMERVLNQHQHLHFHVAGPMVEDNIIEQFQLLKRAYPNRVHDYGYISDEEKKKRLFRMADIFIFPTRRDVFGLVLLDAMAFGLPVVASDEGNIPGILPEEQQAFLFEKENVDQMHEKVTQLIRDDALRLTLGQVNRKRFVEHYTVEQYGQRLIEVFAALERV